MTGDTHRDRRILDAVASVLPDAGDWPHDWAGHVDAALKAIGVQTVPEYYNDDTVAWLSDGRRVVINDPSATGADRYWIDDPALDLGSIDYPDGSD